MFRSDDCESICFDILERDASGVVPEINIDDCFQDGRYHILNKLGQGDYANVWLARDNQNDCNVSIKTIAASGSSDRQLDILQRLNNGDTQHPGYKHTSRLLDFFYYDSPSGRSLFLVMECLGPSLYTMIDNELTPDVRRFSLSLSRQVSRQLLLAVDYLQACGIVHGDINASNVLFCIPTTLQSKSDSWKPQAYEASKKDGEPVDSMWYSEEDCDKFTEVKLVGFSNSFLISDPSATITTATNQCPPELLFKKPLSEAIDIWGLACTTYWLVTSKNLFDSGLSDKRCLVPRYYEVAGEASASWLLTHLVNSVRDGAWKGWPYSPFFKINQDYPSLEKRLLSDFSRVGDDNAPSAIEVAKEKLGILARYLRKMLVVDAKERADTKELLGDEWVQEQQQDE